MKIFKKTLIFFIITVFLMSLPSCVGKKEEMSKAEESKEQIRVWAPEEVVELTQKAIDQWLKTDKTNYSKYEVLVSAMSEDNAATQMLTDVEAGADVYGFAQDQLARLVAAGALSPLGGEFLEKAKDQNDEGSVKAATLEGKTYAYPETSDNGYFMYYDKSVITDPSDLDKILEDCEKNGKKFYMNLQSGWYNITFFFGAGAEIKYNVDKNGNITECISTLATDNGLVAFKKMISFASNGAFAQNENAAPKFNPDGGDAAALISGVWDSSTVSEYLGDNYGAAKLPQFNYEDKQYQMGSFGGYKLVGVKPQKDSEKLVFCHKLASFISGEEMQKIRFEEKGWGPSNISVQQSDKVKGNTALSALRAQLEFAVPQGQYPKEFWSIMEAFGTDINSGKYKDMNDENLMQVLIELENDLKKAK